MTCGRCAREIAEREAEWCWWCMGALCVSCWDQHGECGHPEAAEFVKDAEEARARGELMRLP